jgi:hypothetical protein
VGRRRPLFLAVDLAQMRHFRSKNAWPRRERASPPQAGGNWLPCRPAGRLGLLASALGKLLRLIVGGRSFGTWPLGLRPDPQVGKAELGAVSVRPGLVQQLAEGVPGLGRARVCLQERYWRCPTGNMLSSSPIPSGNGNRGRVKPELISRSTPATSRSGLPCQLWTDHDRGNRMGGSSGLQESNRTDPRLAQTRTAEGFQIVLPVGVALDRHLACDPGERNIGLRAA